MRITDLQPYEMDYVFTPEGTNEYNNIHIVVTPEAEKIFLSLQTEHTMTPSEVEVVLCGLEESFFKKARVNIARECRVVLQAEGHTYDVALADETITVRDLILLN